MFQPCNVGKVHSSTGRIDSWASHIAFVGVCSSAVRGAATFGLQFLRRKMIQPQYSLYFLFLVPRRCSDIDSNHSKHPPSSSEWLKIGKHSRAAIRTRPVLYPLICSCKLCRDGPRARYNLAARSTFTVSRLTLRHTVVQYCSYTIYTVCTVVPLETLTFAINGTLSQCRPSAVATAPLSGQQHIPTHPPTHSNTLYLLPVSPLASLPPLLVTHSLGAARV